VLVLRPYGSAHPLHAALVRYGGLYHYHTTYSRLSPYAVQRLPIVHYRSCSCSTQSLVSPPWLRRQNEFLWKGSETDLIPSFVRNTIVIALLYFLLVCNLISSTRCDHSLVRQVSQCLLLHAGSMSQGGLSHSVVTIFDLPAPV